MSRADRKAGLEEQDVTVPMGFFHSYHEFAHWVWAVLVSLSFSLRWTRLILVDGFLLTDRQSLMFS